MLQQQETTPRGSVPPMMPQPESSIYNDAFIEALAQKLTPRLTERLHFANTRMIGMSLALAIVSLVLMTGVVYMFTMGLVEVTIGGMFSVWQMGTAERILGIGIVCLTVLLVNIVFNIMAFKVKR